MSKLNAFTIYFCNISKKYHLDQAYYREIEEETGNEARVNRIWMKKVLIKHRTILGSNIATFSAFVDALDFSIKTFGQNARNYEPIWSANEFRWIKK